MALFLLITSLTPAALMASQVRLVNLEQMIQRAARIFAGRCIDAGVVFDPSLGRDVTVATFRIHRAVKGVTGKTVTVRMLGTVAAYGTSGDAPAGVPVFRNGEEVILFLYGESALGLSSPVGLGQGRFRILTDKRGRKLALNDFDNKKLLTDLGPEARARLKPRGDPAIGKSTPHQSEEIDPTGLLDAVEALIVRVP